MAKLSKDQLQDKNIQELRELATKQEIEGRSGMSKDELVDALSGGDGNPQGSAKTSTAPDRKPDYPSEYPLAGMTIKGEGKANARLFQTSPDVKEYLTKAEAKAKGFYWADTDEDKDPKKAARQDPVTYPPEA